MSLAGPLDWSDSNAGFAQASTLGVAVGANARAGQGGVAWPWRRKGCATVSAWPPGLLRIQAHGDPHEIGNAVRARLPHHERSVNLDRSVAEIKLSGDLPDGEAARGKVQDFLLAMREARNQGLQRRKLLPFGLLASHLRANSDLCALCRISFVAARDCVVAPNVQPGDMGDGTHLRHG